MPCLRDTQPNMNLSNKKCGMSIKSAAKYIIIAVLILSQPMCLLSCSETAAIKKAEGEKITVCLDAGHGVGDVGAISPFTDADGNTVYEKDINYSLVLIIKEKLEADGYEVILPRSADGEDPAAGYDDEGKCKITKRVEYANANGYDLYISIHCNSFSDSSVSGTRLYYNKGNNGSQNKMLADDFSKSLIDIFGKEPKIYDNADLYAVTATKMPACLIEIGFITNEADFESMMSEEWLKKFAEAVRGGINRYCGK